MAQSFHSNKVNSIHEDKANFSIIIAIREGCFKRARGDGKMGNFATMPATVRLDSDVRKKMRKRLPRNVTLSVVCRALLQAYFEDKIPQATEWILTEAARSDAAIKQGQHALIWK